MKHINHWIFKLTLVLTLAIPAQLLGQDPLPSWNDGNVKSAIIQFVQDISADGEPLFVPQAERIAVFDNDGTLWAEKPIYVQLQFAIDRVKELASLHPEWKQKQPFKAVLENDLPTILDGGKRALMELILQTHTGNTTEEFSQIVQNWLIASKHPETGRLYTEMVYQPMLELLDYLRNHGFKTYIVTGGGVEFVRPWAEHVYGIPPEQVIGSSIKTEFRLQGDVPKLIRLPEINFINDKEGKPVAINQYIARRPIAAFGNSDGDLQMLQWTAAGSGARFLCIVHHTDVEREWAYDRLSNVGRLDKALDEAQQKKWTIIDIKQDWKNIFPPSHQDLTRSSQR